MIFLTRKLPNWRRKADKTALQSHFFDLKIFSKKSEKSVDICDVLRYNNYRRLKRAQRKKRLIRGEYVGA